jgi:hypothetical protein
MASAKMDATLNTLIFGEGFRSGTVSVTINSSMGESSMRWYAGPDNMGCVHVA